MRLLATTSAAALVLCASAVAQENAPNTMVPEQVGITGEEKAYDAPKLEIAEEDVTAEVKDEFEIADADSDGALSQEEFVTAMGDPQPLGEGDEDPAFAPEGEPAEAGTVLPTASEYLIAKFQSISGDDGEVTAEELEEARKKDFSEADVDGDDVLTGEEVDIYAALKSGRTAY
jgi:hypothetical protein